LPDHGGAVPRMELDARIREVALKDGAVAFDGARAVDVERDGQRVTGVVFANGHTVRCRRLIVADGARSTLGRVLGREWHRDTDDEVLAGYGWVFPLSDGEVNIGVGTLATAARPAQIRLRSLIQHYADARREDWQLDGP